MKFNNTKLVEEINYQENEDHIRQYIDPKFRNYPIRRNFRKNKDNSDDESSDFEGSINSDQNDFLDTFNDTEILIKREDSIINADTFTGNSNRKTNRGNPKLKALANSL